MLAWASRRRFLSDLTLWLKKRRPKQDHLEDRYPYLVAEASNKALTIMPPAWTAEATFPISQLHEVANPYTD